MKIKGAIDLSFADWDGKISSVFFLPHCNFRCPFCHNSTIVLHPETLDTIHFERIENYLKKRRDWIEGVCITGGEPTLHRDLPGLCEKFKKIGFPIKLDTNGTNPIMIKRLMDSGLVDYISMDVKAPLTIEKYSKATGINMEKLLGKVKETVKILLDSNMDYELRTTVVPTLHEINDIEEICNNLKGCKKYVLQKFIVSLGTLTLNPTFSELKTFTDEEMNKFLVVAQNFLPNVKLR